MFDFPTNPASGTVVMVPDGSYRVWDSTKWRASPSSSTITTGPFLPIAGGVMTGPLNVTTTGAIRSWSVQDRFAEVIDVQDYGQIGTGNAATDTATMLAAVAALPSNGGVLKIGSNNPASITLNQTITITKSCKILGATANGLCSTIVCLMNGPAILFSDPTPSFQKTFEVENVRFVGNNQTQATQSAIQVSVGPIASQSNPTFIGRNIVIVQNTASVAAPYAQTITKGIEFVPASVSGTLRNFWNVVLEDVTYHGAADSATGQPIAGTAGVAFGMMICASFRNVAVSWAASGFRQTDYCEGITAFSCQLYSVTNGWDMGSFAPVGPSATKSLQPVLTSSMIQALQSAINLDCVYIGVFQGNYLTGAGAVNVALSNTLSTQVCNNFLNTGTTGIALTKTSFNEGGNLVAGNILTNITTHISLGSGTFYDMALDNSTSTSAAPVIVNNGTGNVVRGVAGPLTFANTQPLRFIDANGSAAPGIVVQSDNTLVIAGSSSTGASRPIASMAQHSDTSTYNMLVPTINTALATYNTNVVMQNGRYIQLTDTAGTFTNIGILSDNTLYILGTDASGGSRAIAVMPQRSSTSAFNMLVPMQHATVGFNGTAPIAKPTVSGAKGSNAALASLMTALAAYGLVTDSTTT